MAGPTPAAPKAYDVEDAYEIYSLVLPEQEAYTFAKGALIIQEETVWWNPLGDYGVTPEAATRFKDAIADYKRLNSEQWLLQRRFQIEKPYEIVSSDGIRAAFREGGWDGFDKRYPNSRAYIIMSAVGFNKDKTQAIVYIATRCGGLCGRGGFYVLEKINGKWKYVRGCCWVTVS